MKSWKEYPHLFWKFICLSEVNGKKAKHYVWWILSNDKVGFEENWIDSCTLIARKIEDMTDEETNFVNESNYDALSCDAIRTAWIKRGYDMRGNTLINLLSIGVYPFDQSHFKTGEVINIEEL